MELTEQLIGDCSPYIGNLVYDIDVRVILDNSGSMSLDMMGNIPGLPGGGAGGGG